ncbi:glycoside hydrolase family 3 C-terminal domain-containing protein [bacterium]|nr:glycoside hydrolase family 3 C-terminal domain-containing protein [bacterium]
MKSKNAVLLFISILILLFLTYCAKEELKPTLAVTPSGEKWVNHTLNKMTVEEKIGQMVCSRFSGQFYHFQNPNLQDLESLVEEQKIGGLIMFGGEIYEAARLINSLQEKADVPLLIASDLERGLGNQIGEATLFPPLMSIGATRSEELAYQMGKITAVEARAVGIHLTYAPVVDVNINPQNPIISTRSLGEDPEQVARLAAAFIRGCQENGLMATAKHFPGHGDTDVDSHSELPVVEGDMERLNSVEILPFERAVQAGVQAVMTAHIHVPVLDPTPNLPATLSPVIIGRLLRDKLGFDGLIVTDAMGMGGVTSLYSPEEAALKAVKAGVDCLLLPPETEKVIETLAARVKKGEISETTINSSVRRILTAKAKLGLYKKKLVDIEALDRVIASQKHIQKAEKAFRASVTLVQNKGDILPLSCEDKKISVFSLSSDKGDFYAGRTFIEEVKKRCDSVHEFYADAMTGEKFIEEAVEKSSDSDLRVISLFSSLRARKGSVGLDERHVELINELAEDEIPLLVISFGSPYFLKSFPEVEGYVCAYRRASIAQRAAVEAVFGEIGFQGRLPVSIPGLYERGHGIVLKAKESSQKTNL